MEPTTTISIIDLLSIGVVGSALSIAIQFIKNKWGTESGTTKAITLFMAVGLGALYYFLVNTPLWLPIVGVLGSASVFYAFFLKDTKLGDKIAESATE